MRCTFMVRTQFTEYTWDHSSSSSSNAHGHQQMQNHHQLGRRVRSDDLSQPSVRHVSLSSYFFRFANLSLRS